MTSPSCTFEKKPCGSRQTGKLAKIALRGRGATRPFWPPWRRPCIGVIPTIQMKETPKNVNSLSNSKKQFFAIICKNQSYDLWRLRELTTEQPADGALQPILYKAC